MEVEDGLPCLLAAVDDQPVVLQPLLLRHSSRDGKQVAHKGFILWLYGIGTGDGFARDAEDVDWRGRVDVAEGDGLVVLVDDVCGNLAVGDFLEKRFLVHGIGGRSGVKLRGTLGSPARLGAEVGG